MRVLGIDPGLAVTGYSIVEDQGNRLRAIDFGVIRTPADMETPERLLLIYDSIRKLIDDHKPDCAALEELFYNKNAKTALIIGHARGQL